MRKLGAVGDQERDPVEQLRIVVEYLVKHVAWDEVIRILRNRKSGRRLSATLSDHQKSLLSALQFAKQHHEDGGMLNRHFVEGMAKSLAVPVPALLDSIADLARQLGRIALGKQGSPNQR
ncbi:MAG: hypothetical protein A2W25_15395 [candidate division Zixibacteria bacterium RBG_16_53_22]|nr:MAG: hypothetical protein A2W25_15395 [candidate division Zixibacteria bacterium RBG_16_53_22]